MSEKLGLVGRKIGMTRIFTEDGVSIPVTVLEVSNNRITQVKRLRLTATMQCKSPSVQEAVACEQAS